MNRRVRIILVGVLQVGISAALLIALLRNSSWRALETLLAEVDIRWFVAAVAILVAQQLLGAARWRSLSVGLGGPHLPGSFYVLWQGMAVLLLQVLPSTVGGDLVRAASGARHSNLRLGVGVVVVDRVIGMGVLCGVVLVGSVVFPHLLQRLPALFVPLGMALFGVGACAVVMRWGPWLEQHKLTALFGALGDALVSSLRGLPGLRIGGTSIAIHLLSVLSVLCLLEAASAPRPLALLLVAPAAFLVSAVPISLGGWGVREGAFVVGLGLLGVARETALGVSVLFGVALTLAGVVLAMIGAPLHGMARWKRRAEKGGNGASHGT